MRRLPELAAWTLIQNFIILNYPEIIRAYKRLFHYLLPLKKKKRVPPSFFRKNIMSQINQSQRIVSLKLNKFLPLVLSFFVTFEETDFPKS